MINSADIVNGSVLHLPELQLLVEIITYVWSNFRQLKLVTC